MEAKPKTIVIGGGIGGCTAALALHKAGADVTIYESAPAFMEIGAGINVQAVSIGVLVDLGISLEQLADPALGDGIRTSKIEYYTKDGVFIADEATGTAAGADHPQFSVHRAKFHNTLVAECTRLLGEEHVILNHTFTQLEMLCDGRVTAHFADSLTQEAFTPVTADFLVGCDGLKSRVRAALLGESKPRYTGRVIYRGVCELDSLVEDGTSVVLCGDEKANFIYYPISEGMRQDGTTHCNWGYNAIRPEPQGVENWTSLASVEDIRAELAEMDANVLGGYTPLQMAEKTQKIIAWALFDRDPIDSFDFGTVTLLGDAAHPLLPFGSQGATQAIMDAEALGICYQRAMEQGVGIEGCVKAYSDLRCAESGKVVLAAREMGPTAVLRVVHRQCEGMSKEEKTGWITEHGREMLDRTIQSHRSSMPKSVKVGDLTAKAA